LILNIDDEFPELAYFEYNGVKVRFQDLRPSELNGEYPYLVYDDSTVTGKTATLKITFPYMGNIKIEAANVEIKWPARFWPRMQPMLDNIRQLLLNKNPYLSSNEKFMKESDAKDFSRFKGGSRRRSRKRSRSRRFR
jgi:hypothetical protein